MLASNALQNDIMSCFKECGCGPTVTPPSQKSTRQKGFAQKQFTTADTAATPRPHPNPSLFETVSASA
jgi:hypothetical protein